MMSPYRDIFSASAFSVQPVLQPWSVIGDYGTYSFTERMRLSRIPVAGPNSRRLWPKHPLSTLPRIAASAERLPPLPLVRKKIYPRPPTPAA